MAFTVTNTALDQWYKAYRAYTAPAGTTGTALVSDLIANDYCVGARARVVTPGTTTSGNRTLTVERNGTQFPVVWPAASSIQIIRP
jgi:hypothetical protein